MPEGMYQGLLSGQLVALGVTFAVSLIPAYLRSRRERTVHRLRLVSAAIQQAVLVPLPERDGCVRAAAEYLAADDEARLGGDLYDLVDTPHGVRMIIGDVRGKGLPAVASANNLLGAFREIAPTTATLGELAKRLDESVVRHKRRAGLDDEEFVTATLVSVGDGPHAEVLCCGHAGPLMVHDGAVAEVTTEQPWPPLGLGKCASAEPHVVTVPFAVDDTMLLYTDGVTEARDGTGTFYPLRERVSTWAARSADPKPLVRRLIDDLTAHSGGRLNDDAAVLATQRVAPVGDESGGDAPATGRRDAADRPERRLSGTAG
jgi:serine phosphatase RsbU (regulator of sigma subunit)